MKRCLMGVMVTLLLPACYRIEPVGSTCNANNWQELVGQPEAAVHSALGNVRIIRPGTPVSKDFNAYRLNAEIGADGRVKRFSCY